MTGIIIFCFHCIVVPFVIGIAFIEGKDKGYNEGYKRGLDAGYDAALNKVEKWWGK
jgi:hypothetical protein